MSIFIGFCLWLLLAVVSAVRFGFQPTYSSSERWRLIALGDTAALEEQDRVELVPLVTSMLTLIRALLTVVFVIMYINLFGTVLGVVYATAGLLLVPLVFRLGIVCSLADRLRDVAYRTLVKASLFARPILSWLRERDLAAGDVELHSKEELLDLVRRSRGVLSRDEQDRLAANVAFDEKRVHDVMTPRSMINGVAADETLGPLVLDELYKTGHSRFPVYSKDLDHVVGILYLHDLVELKGDSVRAREAMQKKVCYIREDRDLSHALHGFLSTKHHLFIVINEYRETVGVVSLEDVIEALIGKTIVDEFDSFDDLRAVAEHNPGRNNEPEGKADV